MTGINAHLYLWTQVKPPMCRYGLKIPIRHGTAPTTFAATSSSATPQVQFRTNIALFTALFFFFFEVNTRIKHQGHGEVMGEPLLGLKRGLCAATYNKGKLKYPLNNSKPPNTSQPPWKTPSMTPPNNSKPPGWTISVESNIKIGSFWWPPRFKDRANNRPICIGSIEGVCVKGGRVGTGGVDILIRRSRGCGDEWRWGRRSAIRLSGVGGSRVISLHLFSLFPYICSFLISAAAAGWFPYICSLFLPTKQRLCIFSPIT